MKNEAKEKEALAQLLRKEENIHKIASIWRNKGKKAARDTHKN